MASQKKKTGRKAVSAKKPSSATRAEKKIDTLRLMRLLERHALGQAEMTASQVSVALALLKISAPPAEDTPQGPSHEDALTALA